MERRNKRRSPLRPKWVLLALSLTHRFLFVGHDCRAANEDGRQFSTRACVAACLRKWAGQFEDDAARLQGAPGLSRWGPQARPLVATTAGTAVRKKCGHSGFLSTEWRLAPSPPHQDP